MIGRGHYHANASLYIVSAHVATRELKDHARQTGKSSVMNPHPVFPRVLAGRHGNLELLLV